MKIEEIKEAKIKLEHEIEVSLIEFEKKFGLKIKRIINEDFQIDLSGYTRTKVGQIATYFQGRTESGGAYSLTFIWKENFIIVTAEASSAESFEKNKYRMENIVKTIRTK